MYTKQVTREEYEEIVKGRGYRSIGGSHVLHLMCPENKYSSKYKLYKEITEGRNLDTMSPQAKAGIDLEPWVVKEFLKRNPNFTVDKNSTGVMLISTQQPFVVAAIDRIIVDKQTGERCVLECKTTDSKNDYKWTDDEMPDNYYWQCIHYLWITGLSKCYVACFVGFSEYKQLLISTENKQIRDDIAKLDEEVNLFWYNFVHTGTEPEVDGSEETRITLDQQAANRELVNTIPVNVVEQLKKLPELRARMDAIKREIEFINNSAIASIRGFGKVRVDNMNISYTKVTSERFDAAALKEQDPETYNRFKRTSTYTKFLVTQSKERTRE